MAYHGYALVFLHIEYNIWMWLTKNEMFYTCIIQATDVVFQFIWLNLGLGCWVLHAVATSVPTNYFTSNVFIFNYTILTLIVQFFFLFLWRRYAFTLWLNRKMEWWRKFDYLSTLFVAGGVVVVGVVCVALMLSFI